MKEFVATHQKIISGVLLAFVVIGSLATLLAISWPYLALAAWKYVDGAPDTITITDYFIKLAAYLMPTVPWFLLLGGLSAILYTFVINDTGSRTFLRIWGGVMLLLFLMFMYPYIQSLFAQ